MINNIDIIKSLLKFESDDEFYFVQIIQRKKDFDDRQRVNGTNNNNRLIKAYYIGSLDYLDFVMPEIIELCKVFNARAGIDLNRRSYRRIALHTLKKITDQILNEDYFNCRKAYSMMCGSHSNETEKKWILDYDGGELPYQNYKCLKKKLADIQPIGQKVIETIPSKNGLHIITSPFNVKEGEGLLKEYKLTCHKRNPTNLYIP